MAESAEWQVLLAILLTVLTAAMIVKLIKRPKELSKPKDAREPLVRAYRASMVEDLDAICSYAYRSSELARETLMIIREREAGGKAEGTNQNRRKVPALPSHVLGNLKGLVEHLDDANGESIADLLECYYAQRAQLRLLETPRQPNLPIAISKAINLNAIFRTTLELYLRALGMVQFASGQTEKMPRVFNRTDVLNALKVLELEQAMSPEGREHCLKTLSAEDVPQSRHS
jgi:hypothetical protein